MLRFSPNLEQHLPPFSPSPGSSTPHERRRTEAKPCTISRGHGRGGGSWEEREHHLKSTSSLCPRPPSIAHVWRPPLPCRKQARDEGEVRDRRGGRCDRGRPSIDRSSFKATLRFVVSPFLFPWHRFPPSPSFGVNISHSVGSDLEIVGGVGGWDG